MARRPTCRLLLARGRLCFLSATGRTTKTRGPDEPATSFSQAGGARVRTVQLLGSPFGGESLSAARDVSALNIDLMGDYGHAGPRFIHWLISRRPSWPSIRRDFREAAKAYASQARSGPEARMAEIRAVLELTHHCMELALGLNVPNPVPDLWDEVTADIGDAAGARRGLADTVGWILANEMKFKGRGEDEPHSGWLGAWQPGGRDLVAVHPYVLKKFLEAQGYSARGILEEWRGKGWMEVDSDRPNRLTKRIRIGKSHARCHCLPMRLFVTQSGSRVTRKKPSNNGEFRNSGPNVTQRGSHTFQGNFKGS